MRKLFSELKRRHVFRVAWIYVVAAWAVIQVVDTITPALDWPPDLVRIVIYIAVACFPLALILAWAFDVTAEGVGPLVVAVFPFLVQGGPGELYLREGMVSLLSTKLDGAGELRAAHPMLFRRRRPRLS